MVLSESVLIDELNTITIWIFRLQFARDENIVYKRLKLWV